tara:strand:- start:18675 stop:19361 length:687 start_codon:yes stop_codon:yes gene_type:complete
MFFIRSKKIIFLSNPKTGTTTVQKILKNHTKDKLNRVYLDSIKSDSYIRLKEHGNVRELNDKLGSNVNDFIIFVFIRSPYDRCVSAYHHYKNGRPNRKKLTKRKLLIFFNLILAKVLPFSFWVLIKPIKYNYKYVLDNRNKISVNHVGVTSKLLIQLDQLLKLYQIEIEFDKSMKENTSRRLEHEEYFKNSLLKKLFKLKYKKDIDLFHKIKKYSITDDLRGLDLKDL